MANDSRRGRIVVIAIVVSVIALAILLTKVIHVSSADYVKHLDSNDPDTVAYALVILKDRNDPAGIDKAENLVKSDNPQIWINAAVYLGAIGKSDAVPYLVRALTQADLDQGIQIVQQLKQFTGMPFGNDVNAWEGWWNRTHPAATKP
jgi:HEAT repeat protein